MNIVYLLAQSIDPSKFPQPNVEPTIASILKTLFMVVAFLSLIFVAIGGFKYTTANGDPQGIASAKNTIIAALVGLIIGISAFTITSFVVGSIAL